MKRIYFECQLECECKVVIMSPFGMNAAICPNHMGLHTILAIETREWHIKCNVCRYARWAGTSIIIAKDIERKHLYNKPDHSMSRFYMAHPDTIDTWRKVYGRKRFPKRYINSGQEIQIPKRVAYSGITEIKENNESGTDTPPF